MSINWSTVTTSVIGAALTALLVTLLIEYAAKPGIEARKERLLEDARRRRQIPHLAWRLFQLAKRIEDSVSSRDVAASSGTAASTADRVRVTEREAERDVNLMRDLVNAVTDDQFHFTRALKPRSKFVVTRMYLKATREILLREDMPVEWRAHRVAMLSATALRCLETSRWIWYVPKWRRARHKEMKEALEIYDLSD